VSIRIPLDVYSPDQLSTLVADLQTYRSQLRDFAVRAKATKSKQTETPEVSEVLANFLRNSNVKDDDKQLETLQHELQTTLKNAPVMHVTLAAPAGLTLKRQLTVWFRTQIHEHSLLTFTARSDIGGGIMLQAGSHFYDYSFKDHIIANKARLTEIAGV
jgi:F0F1-type ATP synthase delta subunit